MKYLYLLKFKDEPLIKIGQGTKTLSANYARIKQHMLTYKKGFDLSASYVITLPNNSIRTLESDLKDCTQSFKPSEETILKYKGKDGYTEIRTLKSLPKIIRYLKDKQKHFDVVIDIQQGIKFPKPKPKPIAVKKELVKKEKKLYKPFELTPDHQEFNYFFKHQYQPILSNVNGWSISDTLERHEKNGNIRSTFKGYFLKLSIEKSFLHEAMKELNIDFDWQSELSGCSFPWCWRYIYFNGKKLRNIEFYVREEKNFDYNPDRDIVYFSDDDYLKKFGNKDLDLFTPEEREELDYIMYGSPIDKQNEYEALYQKSETLSAEITFGIYKDEIEQCPEYLTWFISQFVEPLKRLFIRNIQIS